MKKLILWDIDGTLIISHGAGIRALERAFGELYGKPGDLSIVDWAGRTDTWIVGEILRHNAIPPTPENCHEFLENYLRVLPAELKEGTPGQVLPGVLTLLEILHHRKDIAQGLLTGNLERGARLKLTHYEVWHYFTFGAYADDSPRRNDLGPHAVRRAREKHAVDFAPENVFIIGDTPHDVECGKVIGARTIAVATGKYSVDELRAHAPTVVFENFADTTAFLRAIDGA